MADDLEEKTPPGSPSTPGNPDETPASDSVNDTWSGVTPNPADTPSVYSHSSDPYGSEPPVPSGTPELTASESPSPVQPPTPVQLSKRPPVVPPTPPSSTDDDGDEDDEEDEGMLRMSFMEHLEELRSRILQGLGGSGRRLHTQHHLLQGHFGSSSLRRPSRL